MALFRSFPDRTLEWMAEQDATIDETAIWFLKNHAVWTDWVPPEVEQRVKDALAEEAP